MSDSPSKGKPPIWASPQQVAQFNIAGYIDNDLYNHVKDTFHDKVLVQGIASESKLLAIYQQEWRDIANEEGWTDEELRLNIPYGRKCFDYWVGVFKAKKGLVFTP